MDIVEIFKALPPEVSRTLQLKLEDTPVSKYLLPEEVEEIVVGVINRLGPVADKPEIQPLLKQVPNAVVRKIFG